jgi:excinuclease ABC subunit B
MYADRITNSMARALDATNSRRERQTAYNIEHGIEPRSIIKEVRDLTGELAAKSANVVAEEQAAYVTAADLPKSELSRMIKELEKQMKIAAQALEFEKAAVLRDQIVEMRQIMIFKNAGKGADLPEWERLRLLDEAGIESN